MLVMECVTLVTKSEEGWISDASLAFFLAFCFLLVVLNTVSLNDWLDTNFLWLLEIWRCQADAPGQWPRFQP